MTARGAVAGRPPFDVALAGFHIRLVTAHPELLTRWRTRFARFTCDSAAEPAITLEVHREPVAHFISPASGVMEIDWSVRAGRLTFRSTYEQAALDLTAGRGEVALAPEGDPENLLRVYLAYQCLMDGGLVMHSSGAVRDALAYLFFGPSGAGKTTIALISERAGYAVLGDDIVAIRKEAGRFWAYSLPFGNREDFGARQSLHAPLAALFRLRKAPAHAIGELPQVQALTELIAATPFIHVQKELTERALLVCQELQSTLPVKQLFFYPHESLWELLPQPL